MGTYDIDKKSADASDPFADSVELARRAEALEGEGRFDQAADAWSQAAVAATRSGDQHQADIAHLGSARCRLRTETVGSAAAELDVACASDDALISAFAHELRGELLRRSDDEPAAEQALRRAVERFAEAAAPADQARALRALGDCIGWQGRYADALELMTQSRDMFRTLGLGFDAARSDDRVAATLIEVGRLDEALQRLTAVARIAETSGDQSWIAFAQYRMGWTLTLADRPSDALPWLRRARDLYGELQDLPMAAECEEKAAQALSSLGESDQAVDLYERAIAVFEAFGRTHSARLAECNLAALYADNGRYDETVDRLRDLFGRLETDGDYLRSGVGVRLAVALLESGDGNGALSVLDQVSDHFADCEGVAELALYRCARARALLAGGAVSSAASGGGRCHFDGRPSDVPGAARRGVGGARRMRTPYRFSRHRRSSTRPGGRPVPRRG